MAVSLPILGRYLFISKNSGEALIPQQLMKEILTKAVSRCGFSSLSVHFVNDFGKRRSCCIHVKNLADGIRVIFVDG